MLKDPVDYTSTVILVLDEQKENRLSFCNSLLKMGFPENNILCADTISEALQVFDEYQPDIVCADFHTCRHTENDGYSICGFLQAAKESKIPVIMTAYIGDTFGPLRFLAMKVQGTIRKPVNPLDLKATLDRSIRLSLVDRLLEKLMSGPL